MNAVLITHFVTLVKSFPVKYIHIQCFDSEFTYPSRDFSKNPLKPSSTKPRCYIWELICLPPEPRATPSPVQFPCRCHCSYSNGHNSTPTL